MDLFAATGFRARPFDGDETGCFFCIARRAALSLSVFAMRTWSSVCWISCEMRLVISALDSERVRFGWLPASPVLSGVIVQVPIKKLKYKKGRAIPDLSFHP
ncbi:hypothetical protein [Roseibium sp. Sym1]|uniref:hypothetical protein n=1 Tax=Roseibium sp. Sym1 TaxID=3016006 RepID=UPI0022B56F15|nr:hypothetical protein [Roseibium sp. Sym1]